MRTGFAVGCFTDVKPRCNYWDIPKRPYGERFAIFENTLIAAINEWRPTFLVRAMPLIGGKVGMARARLALGWDTIIEATCYRMDVKAMEQPEGTVRKECLPKGWNRDTEAAVMEWAKLQGIDVNGSHDAADSALLWRWTRDELVRQRRLAA